MPMNSPPMIAGGGEALDGSSLLADGPHLDLAACSAQTRRHTVRLRCQVRHAIPPRDDVACCMSWRQVADSVSHAVDPKAGTCASRSLEAFLRELPVPLARAGPMLPTPRNAGDLEALVEMQPLQLTFVYGKVLSKKARVRRAQRPPRLMVPMHARFLKCLRIVERSSADLVAGSARPPVFPRDLHTDCCRPPGTPADPAAQYSRKLQHARPA